MNKLIDKIIKKAQPRRKQAKDKDVDLQPRIGIFLPPLEMSPSAQRKVPPAEKTADTQPRILLEWMRSAREYFRQFLAVLRTRDLIFYEDLDHYIKAGDIYRDFRFIAPAVPARKARILKAGRSGGVTGNIDRDLKRLPNLRLLFVFGMKNWEALHKRYRPTLLNPRSAPASTRITKVHGLPFSMEFGEKKIVVIPLVQMDQKVFNNLLRNSYFDYLSEGLDIVGEHLTTADVV
ncbi:MAG: hypothetical protein ACOX8W_07030 [bacterium]|jgi:hypothetical protein